MKSEFIVIEIGIDARNSEMKLENPASIDEPRYKIRQRQTEPFCYQTGFVALT
jgi:hypothetical protein